MSGEEVPEFTLGNPPPPAPKSVTAPPPRAPAGGDEPLIAIEGCLVNLPGNRLPGNRLEVRDGGGLAPAASSASVFVLVYSKASKVSASEYSDPPLSATRGGCQRVYCCTSKASKLSTSESLDFERSSVCNVHRICDLRSAKCVSICTFVPRNASVIVLLY
jgi:hypothetical protein